MALGRSAIIAASAIVALAGAAFAAGGPPAGVPMGPPAFVTHGPPAFVTKGPPPGVGGPPAAALSHSAGPKALGLTSAGQANAASELGKLNAAHASPVALAHAAPNSAVGMIATYQTQMGDALALTDPAQRDAAIISAREQLGLASNKQLTPSAAARIDGMLGITGASPDLGTTP